MPRRSSSSSANPYASEAGRRILRAGGGAVDAAIAVQLVLTLVEPQSSGIGGGAFMLVYAAPDDGDAGAITAYEGRETAPAAATPDMFLGANGRQESFANVGVGGLAVGVPGALRMLELAHREHGRLPWADLFAPAIELAENGFPVSPRLFGLLNGFKRFARGDDFRRYFYDASGEPHPVGHLLKNPEYAAALKALAAAGGAEPMHTGELAAAIAAEIRDNNVRPGRMTLEDLARYEANVSPPLCTPYREWRVCGPQLPSSGGVTTQQVLGILAQLELPDVRTQPVQAIHLFAEASRLAFADRNLYLGDAKFVAAPVAGLLDAGYLRERASLIDPDKAMASVAPGNPLPAAAWRYAPGAASERPSTSHFSIVDRFGDAVAMTTSVQGAFGSQLMVGGFILNNQLTDFDYVPAVGGKPVANRVEGGKRPLSSMAPTMLLDRARAAAPARRLAGRHAHHRLRRAEHRRRRRLGARRAAGRRGAALPRRGRADRARGRHRARGSRAGARGSRAQRRAERHEQRPARDRDRVHAPRPRAVRRRRPAPRGRRPRRLSARD